MPKDAYTALPYRPCVGVMLIDADGLAFVGRRIDNKEGDWWQMPQGGVDKGEDLEDAVFRELAEETGVGRGHASIVAQSRKEHVYDLPDALMGKLWGGKYRGQRQTWFLMRFTGSDADVNLTAHNPPEFEAWRWVEPRLLPQLIVPFKRAVYEAVVAEFGPLI